MSHIPVHVAYFHFDVLFCHPKCPILLIGNFQKLDKLRIEMNGGIHETARGEI